MLPPFTGRLEPAMVTFREFVMGLRPRLRSNEHWRPQVDFLVYETYDDYFCVEMETQTGLLFSWIEAATIPER